MLFLALFPKIATSNPEATIRIAKAFRVVFIPLVLFSIGYFLFAVYREGMKRARKN